MDRTAALELLERGADVVDEGWTQGTLWQGDGAGKAFVCSIGGIFVAAADRLDIPRYEQVTVINLPEVRTACQLLADAIEKQAPSPSPDPFYVISIWNNKLDRTAAEVSSLMRAVAATERAKLAPPRGAALINDREAVEA